MIRVCAFSRLHFGLFSLPADDRGLSQRSYGGVGLMVRAPGLELIARPAPDWSATGPLAERTLTFAARFAQSLEGLGITLRPHHFLISRAGPEHTGLGTGTQLGLAVAKALAEAHGLGRCSAADLARRVGRGARSALGVYGFEQGGFLVEAGKTKRDALSPLVARLEFAPAWRIVLVLPAGRRGLHGQTEEQAFQRLAGLRSEPTRTDVLCRLTLLGMLPALAERDLAAFGEALYEFNRLVGESFRSVQGGTYSHAGSEEVVAFVRKEGVPGVGQSSWGPALFAVVADREQADHLASRLRERFGFGPDEVLVTEAANGGAEVA